MNESIKDSGTDLKYKKPHKTEVPGHLLSAGELGLLNFKMIHDQRIGVVLTTKKITRFLQNAGWESIRMEAFRNHVSFIAFEESLKIPNYKYQINTRIWEKITSKLKNPNKKFYRREIRASAKLTNELKHYFHNKDNGEPNEEVLADHQRRCSEGERSLPVEALIKIIDHEREIKAK